MKTTALEIRDKIKEASALLLGVRFDVVHVMATYDEMLDIKLAVEDAKTQAKEALNDARQRLIEISNAMSKHGWESVDQVEQAISELGERNEA